MPDQNQVILTSQWAEQHGRPFTWTTALDNYPHTRNFAHGRGWEYDRIGGSGAIITGQVNALRQPTRAVYLLDDGHSVRPFYVAGWPPDRELLYLHPFPLSEGTRPDGRAIDMSGWWLGPSRAYHLKVTWTEPT